MMFVIPLLLCECTLLSLFLQLVFQIASLHTPYMS